MDCLGTCFTHAQTECNSCSKCFGMDCFGTCFTHARTSDVKPPCKRPRSPLQRWRQPLSSILQAPFQALFKPLRSPLHLRKASSPLEATEGEVPLKPPWSLLEAPFKPSSSLSKPPSPSEGFKPPSSLLETPFKPLSNPWSLPKVKPLVATLKPPWSLLEASFKPSSSLSKPPSPSEGFKPPSSPLEAPLKPHSSPLEAFQRWSPLEAPLKPPWTPFKPPWSPLEAFRRWSPLRPSDLRPPLPLPPDPSSPLEGGFWRGYLGTSPLSSNFTELWLCWTFLYWAVSLASSDFYWAVSLLSWCIRALTLLNCSFPELFL